MSPGLLDVNAIHFRVCLGRRRFLVVIEACCRSPGGWLLALGCWLWIVSVWVDGFCWNAEQLEDGVFVANRHALVRSLVAGVHAFANDTCLDVGTIDSTGESITQ